MAKIEVYNTICYFFVEFVITNGGQLRGKVKFLNLLH